MRKLFYRCGVIAAVAIALCLTADYAARHPQALLVQCAGIVCNVGRECSPVLQLSRAIAHKVFPSSQTTDETQADEEVALRAPDEPEPIADALPDPLPPLAPAPTPIPTVEPIDLIQAQALAGKGEEGNDGQRLPADPVPAIPTLEDLIPMLPADADDEGYTVMPTCTDNDDDLPARMPYVMDEEPAEASQSLAASKSCPCPNPSSSGSVFHEVKKADYPAAAREKKLSPKAMNDRAEPLLRPQQMEEEWPVRTRVDTLEFRPSDAKEGEFDPIPF